MAFFIIFCGKYARASDNLLRLPSIAKYSHERLDEAVRETNAVPMNPYLITETDDIGDVTIDERTIVIGTGGGDCAGLNAFIRRVVLRAAELNADLKPGEKKWRVVGVGNNYDGMTADDWQAKPAEQGKPAERGKLTELIPEKVKQAQDLPSTFLGSCRRKLSGEDLAKIAKRFGKAAVLIISGGNDHLKGVEQIADFIRDPEAAKKNEIRKIAKFIRGNITNQKREQLLGDLDKISEAAGKMGDEKIARLKKDFKELHDGMSSSEAREKKKKEELTKLVVKFVNFAKAFNEYLEYVEVELAGKKPNLRTVGVPKSIDNDFGDDDKMAMLGFKSAYRFGRQIASRASLDPENTENTNKVAVFEVMGRGWHSLTENCAKGCPYPYATIIPGKKVSIDEIIDVAKNKGIKNFFVSEGFSLSEKDPRLGELLAKSPMLRVMWDKAIDPEKRAQDAHGNPKLTGASLYVVGILKLFCELEVEQTDLTYELRGAFPQAGASDPVAFDIALAELFGDAAVSIGLDKTKESGLALTYPGYEDANKQVTPKPAKDVYKSRKLKGTPEEEDELAKFGVLGLKIGFNAADQIRNAEVPKIDGSIESAGRKFSYGINISTRTHRGASVVEFRIPDEAMVSACGREQDLESIADGRGLRTVVEATKDSVLLLISQERVSFSEIADMIKAIYSKLGYVNAAISNDFALNKYDKLLNKILDNDPVLKARFENEARDLGDGWVKFDSGVSHFIVGLFKECGVKKGTTRVTNSGYAFRGLAATSSPDILKDRNLLGRQGVVMAKPAAGQLAAGEDDERIFPVAVTSSKDDHPWHKEIITPDGTIFAPWDADRPIGEEEGRKLVQDARLHGGQVRLMVENDDMMTYVAGDVLTNLMDSAQFTFNIGLATGGTTESLRKMLGLSGMLYNMYGRIMDPEKIKRICTLDNYYFINYLKERGVTEEEAEKILAISSYESEQLYMMIENLMGGSENVKHGFFVAPSGRSSLDWFGEAERFRRLMLKYFVVQLWQLHGIGSNSHDAFNEVYARVQRDMGLAGLELYKDRQAKRAVLRDGTNMAKYGMDKAPAFAKVPLEFSSMGNMRPDHASLISFIIQVQNAGHFIPGSFHPFFLKFMADNSLYDVDELIAGILSMDQEQLCNYTSNPKYHFRDIQHFVDELNFLFKHYSDVPLESITQGTEDILTRGSSRLQDGSYPLQVFMASKAHKQLAVLRALTGPVEWSTAYTVLNKAKAALLVATQESLAKVSDRDIRNTFFIVEPENPNVRGLSEGSIEGNWQETLPGRRIRDLMFSM